LSFKGTFEWGAAEMNHAQEETANSKCTKSKENVFVYV